MAARTLNLQGANNSVSVRVGDRTAITAVLSGTLGTAVVEIQESVDDTTFVALSPAAEMQAGAVQIINRGIFGSPFIRFTVKTLDAGADAAAVITYYLW